MCDNNNIVYNYTDNYIVLAFSFFPYCFSFRCRWQVYVIRNRDIPRVKVISLASRVCLRKDAEERKRERHKFSRWFFIRISSQRNGILLGGMEPEQAIRGGNCEVQVGTLPQYCSWITFSTRYSAEGRGRGGDWSCRALTPGRYYMSASSFFPLFICLSVPLSLRRSCQRCACLPRYVSLRCLSTCEPSRVPDRAETTDRN